MRVAFQYRAVHECPGVAFVGVADDVFRRSLSFPAVLPLLTGRKARPAPPPQPRFFHFVYNIFGGLLQGFGQGGVAASGDIVLNLGGVDVSAVFQDNLLLVPGAWEVLEAGENIVGLQCADDELRARIVAEDEFLDQSLGDNRVDVAVAYRGIARLADNHQRLGIAVPHAADLYHRAVELTLFNLVTESLEDIQGSGGATARGRADHDNGLFIPQLPPVRFGALLYLLKGSGYRCLFSCFHASLYPLFHARTRRRAVSRRLWSVPPRPPAYHRPL
ncbi:hypothetical protein ES703_86436 [subsurface metagenome]